MEDFPTMGDHVTVGANAQQFYDSLVMMSGLDSRSAEELYVMK